MDLAYSIHLGSDKNKSKSAKKIANNNSSGTTSFSNNSIQNSGQLSKVSNHNLRKYDDKTELISVIHGSNSLANDVKNLYLKEFENARIEYNNKQTREDRKIQNYYNNVNKNANRDLACELIIELGDMDFWQDKNKEYKYKMVQVYKEQVEDLQIIIPEFKVANAVIHFDEASPHLHIVGVPVKYGYKNGMKKQVAKSLIFTKERLVILQDKMRTCCIKSFNKEYNLKYSLKTKEKGRDEYISVNKMKGYRELKKQHEQNKQRLAQANQKTDLLSEKTDNIQKVLQNLKPSTLNKKNLIVPASTVDTIKAYMEDVRTTTKSIKGVNDLDVIMKEYEKDLKEHDNKIWDLENTIQRKDAIITKLSTDLKYANDTVSKQKSVITSLKEQVANFKGLWEKLWRFFENKVRWNKDISYTKITDELYDKKIFSSDDVQRIKTGYVPNANNKKKNYDKF
jgi:hypothetical protein